MNNTFFYLSLLALSLMGASCASQENITPDSPFAPVITFDEDSYQFPVDVPATISGIVTSSPALTSVSCFVVNGTEETALGVGYTTQPSLSFSQTFTPTVRTTGFKVVAKNQAGEETVKIAAIAVTVDEATVNNLPVEPKNHARNAYIDTYLRIEFPSSPKLGTAGVVAIYQSDGLKVDELRLDDAQPQLSNGSLYASTKIDLLACSDRVRAVNYRPFTVQEKTLVIKPHYGVLEYGKEYYVTIDASVVEDVSFDGVAAGQWTFATKANVPTATSVTVDDDGDADFRTIQAAIAYSVTKGKDEPVTIQIKNGTYEELLFVRNKNNLTLLGESRAGVVITYDNYDQWNGGTGGSISRPAAGEAIATAGGRAVFLMESCDMLRLENLTLTNSHGPGNQAETMYFNSSYRLLVVNCNLHSNQDTMNIKGYCWFYNTLVAGDVDFIWGGAQIALFEQCEIRSVTANGYILQARVPAAADKGFVFLECRLTKGAGVADNSTWLARSAGNASYYDNISFIRCRMDTHIATAGWYNSPAPNPTAASASAGWKEYGSMDLNGAALPVSGRLSPASCQLTESEYNAGYKDRATIFAGYTNGSAWMN
ncbi:MAG: Ig-like domain-containing protein [Prevotellaceae bacterium]|jgi:pectin methylesterase-like acyl-CoA thioesterase|nr:Ig-like domain-containing protein [Prevotellaceae bacterium]